MHTEIMCCIIAWAHQGNQCIAHYLSVMLCVLSKGVRGSPGERGETGQQGEVVSSVVKHFASIKYMWDGLCYWGYEWLIRSPPHLPGCSRRTGIWGDCGLSGSEGMFSPSLWFVIVSKTLLLCLVGNLTIPIHSWNREMKAYPELKDLKGHGVAR